MLELFGSFVGAVVAFGAGVFIGPHLTGTAVAVQNAHAVSKAKSFLAAEEAHLKALEAARKLVAAQPTGPTGATSAKVTTAVTGSTGAQGPLGVQGA